MNILQKNVVCMAVLGLTVSGCGALGELESSNSAAANKSGISQISSESDVKAALESGRTPSQILIRSGVDFLLKGELDKAQSIFNTALKFDFNNANLHFLNALAYHQNYLRGDADSFSLAKAGYRTALLQDPSLETVAYLQLGRLFLDAKDHASAKQSFAMAVDKNRQSADALYGLAQAAAFDGDLVTSYWAANELERIKWDSPLLYRLKAIHAALAQQPERARAWTADYAKSTGDRIDAKYLQGRVDQLLAIKTSLEEDGSSEKVAPTVPDAKQKQGAPSIGALESGEPRQLAKWFRCDNVPGIPSRSVVSAGGAGANDESITFAPLPAPCPGEMPKTAIIEVTMIQTEETKGKNMGINLLDGLAAIFTLQRARTYTQSTNVAEEVRSNKLVVANTIDNSVDVLRYSLNIANAAHTRSEVLARPTLAAIDRVPAVFFSGATITLGIAGVGGGASSVVDKPVGVSLTVTPTFIDDENVLVSMRATRSFIETGLVPAGSSILLQQSRNSINASSTLKFGETFVVSGLSAQQNVISQSGTPVLQDIPILQYLFKRSQKVDSTLQIVTLITIRRPPDNEAEAGKRKTKSTVSPHKLSGTVNEFLQLQSTPLVVDEVLSKLKLEHQRYRWLREKDLMQEGTASKSTLQSILDDFKETIYF